MLAFLAEPDASDQLQAEIGTKDESLVQPDESIESSVSSETVSQTTSVKPEETAKPEETHTPDETEKADETERKELVWIPTNGGKKYHSKSSCSQMKEPIQVTKEDAIEEGFEPCGRCYK